MANETQIMEKSDTLQQAILNGEINSLSVHRGQGQNQSAKVVDLDTVINRVLSLELTLEDLEKAACLVGPGKYTVLSQLVGGGGIGPKYTFNAAGIKDQNLKEQLMQEYGMNISNPFTFNNNKQNGNTQSQTFGGNNNLQTMQAIQQLLGLKNQQQQPNDVLGMLANMLAPTQVGQTLQYQKQEIENIVKDLKREFNDSKMMHNNELLQYKNEQINRNAEHKKELQDIERKHEEQMRRMQDKYDNDMKDIRREYETKIERLENAIDRKFSDLSNRQSLELITLKNETSGNNKGDDFIKMFLTMTQQEKMEATRQLSESKNNVDQTTAKMMEVFLSSQNNNPMTEIAKSMILAQMNQKTTDPNLKTIKDMAELLTTLKEGTTESSSKWDKIIEYGAPMLAKVAEGAVQGIMNRGGKPNLMQSTVPYIQQYPPAPTVQPPQYQPPATTNVTPFPKVNPIPQTPVIQNQTVNTSISNPIIPEIIDDEISDDTQIDLPNPMLLQQEFENPQTQSFLGNRVFPIFVQDNPELIAAQLFDAVGELDDSKICPEFMKVIHTIEDALWEEDYEGAFTAVHLMAAQMGLEMSNEQIQQTRNIFECYSKILREQPNQEEINNDK